MRSIAEHLSGISCQRDARSLFGSQDAVKEFPPLRDRDIFEAAGLQDSGQFRCTLDFGLTPRFFGSA